MDTVELERIAFDRLEKDAKLPEELRFYYKKAGDENEHTFNCIMKYLSVSFDVCPYPRRTFKYPKKFILTEETKERIRTHEDYLDIIKTIH